jgi:predicted CopG family antitoxin
VATKTISLELDAYERLKTAKRPGESSSEVVRCVLNYLAIKFDGRVTV